MTAFSALTDSCSQGRESSTLPVLDCRATALTDSRSQGRESSTLQVLDYRGTAALVLENKTLCSTCMFQKRYSMREKRFSELSEQYEVVMPMKSEGAAGVQKLLDAGRSEC